MKTQNEEIQYLSQMLSATTADDAARLIAISQKINEIAELNPGVIDLEGNYHPEAQEPPRPESEEPPCLNCEHPGPEAFQNGAWRCPECFGMGWVPSKTEADTDPCPKCEGGFSPQNHHNQ